MKKGEKLKDGEEIVKKVEKKVKSGTENTR